MMLRDAGLRFPVYLTVPNSGGALATYPECHAQAVDAVKRGKPIDNAQLASVWLNKAAPPIRDNGRTQLVS